MSSNFIPSNRPNPYEVDVSAQRARAQQELADAKQEREGVKGAFAAADQEKASSCKDLAAVTKQMQTIERDIGAQVLKSIPYSDNI